MTEIDREHPAPPAGEEIHLPGPSLIPILSAAGITLAVIGTTIRWIADTRRDIDALPGDHHPSPH